ncbi:biotin/lipoyl-containing protein [Pantoea sp. 18069]|uniref:acetyl-CoA carboxylase biotin carboxyl carrier protein n=1 Tax=Pantoea sp. 18069 TaxID=2681415 RepID=UPI00135AFF99|nr:biotin/lipoyl-containing protein [Pantoea sp. 18069]
MAVFDMERVTSLIAAAAQAQVDELELSEAGLDVRIVRRVDGSAAPAAPAAPVPEPVAAVSPAAPAQPGAVAAPAGAPVRTLKAAMAGNFYRAPTPDGAPLVEEGASVEPGTVLGILESMKIMNEIESECRARILRVLCGNGELVAAGQPLFELQEC